MAITLNDNLQINTGKPIDTKYLNGSNQPYANVAEVNSTIPQSYRYEGLKVNVNNVEYWYYTGTADGDLVPLETPGSVSGITEATNGITLLGDDKTVVLGGALTGDTNIFLDSNDLVFSGSPAQYASDYSGQYDARKIPDVGYVSGLTSGLQTQIDSNDADILYLSGQTDLKLDITDFDVYSAATAIDISQNTSDIQLVSGVTTTNTSDIQLVSGVTTTNTSDIQLVSGVTTTNTANIATNVTNIQTNTDDITFLGVFSGDTVADLAFISGQTDANTTAIGVNAGNILDNADDILYLSGETDTNTTNIVANAVDITALGALSGITEVSLTGVTNGLTKVGIHSAKLGGTDLSENTTIGLGGYGMVLGSGSTIANYINVNNLAITTSPSTGTLSNGVLVWDTVDKKVKQVDGALFGQVSGATNGLSVNTDKEVVLGGDLTGDTCVTTASHALSFGIAPTDLTGVDSIVLAGGSVTGACAVAMSNGIAGGDKSIAFSDGKTIGSGSFAFGTGSVAYANNSAAFGGIAKSCGIGSFAFGTDVTTCGDHSQAFGSGSTATGTGSFAIGTGSLAIGINSQAFGGGHACGDASWARGAGSCAVGAYSSSIGGFNKAYGIGSLAIGNSNITCASGAFALGRFTTAAGANSFAFGKGWDITKPVLASGESSINFSTNTDNQLAGHGADADYSTILGGINHHVQVDNLGAAIIGRFGTSGIELTGSSYTDHTVVGNFAIWGTPIDNVGDGVLTWDMTTKKVGKSTIGELGALSGTTNGLQTLTGEVGLGGTLCLTNTNILGATCNLSMGTSGSRVGIRNDFSGTHIIDATALACVRSTIVGGNVVLDAQNQGKLFIKSQEGAVAGGTFTCAVGINMDYAGNIFTIIDKRNGVDQAGIKYQTDYSANYTDRSLVDKAYVDSVAAGLDAKDAVIVATTSTDGDINLALFAGTIDGLTVEDGWRVLIKNQTDPIENGIYDYSGSSSGFTRSTDFDGNPTGEVSNGAYTLVITGDTLINTQWVVTSPDPIDVGTDDINWSLLSQQLDIQAGSGITITTLNSKKTISVKPIVVGSALSFDSGLGLRVDESIAGSGLTMTNGIVDVCANTGAVTTEIDVYFGASNQLVVREEDFSYTQAANGLVKSGSVITLGGDLTGNTNIDGTASCHNFTLTGLGTFDVTFDSVSTITDTGSNGGLRYATNYDGNFLALSIPHVGYVTGLTSGLQTQITTNANNIATNTADISFLGVFSADTIADLAFISGATDTNTADIATNVSDIQLVSGVTTTNAANIATNVSDISDNAVDIQLVSGVTTTNAANIATNAADILYITGNTINTANNGLTKTGTNVKLGGTALSENTSIDLGGFGMVLGSGSTIANYINVNNLAIGDTPSAGDSADSVLVWDSADNKVKSIAQSSITTGADNGLSINSANEVVLGGTLTGDTCINTATFGIAMGVGSVATGAESFAFGYNVSATGTTSFAEGYETTASGNYSHAEGYGTTASGSSSHAEGCCTTASGSYGSHSEGCGTVASGDYGSHAEGFRTTAIGIGSHAEGRHTIANDNYSHAEGECTSANGYASHSGGIGAAAKYIFTCGIASFNHSFNDVLGQTAGHGALSDYSAILGGQNHNIESGNTGAAIIGGDTIKLTGTTYIDHTAVANLAIMTTPNAGGSNDVLTLDSLGRVTKVTQASIAAQSAVSADNGLSVGTSGNVVLGGSLTGDTTINLNSNDLTFSTNPLQYAATYSAQYDEFSIPDVGYITGLTSGLQTQITTNANNISTNIINIGNNADNITFLGVFSGDTVADLAFISGQTDDNTADIAFLGTVSGVTEAINGLSKTANNEIKLGGALTGNTVVDTNTHGLVFGNGTAAATGTDAIAFGNSTTASGTNAIAAGSGSIAQGTNSFAFGNSACACATSAVAFGTGKALGFNSFAHGGSATGDSAVAFGFGIALGACSFAIGVNALTKVGANSSVTMGSCPIAYSSNNVILGNGKGCADGAAILGGFGGNVEGNYGVLIGGSLNTTCSPYSVVLGGQSVSVGTGYNEYAVASKLAIWSAPDSGSISTDAVLVWNSIDKKVKQIAADTLGEDNNLYNITGVSANVTLTANEYVVVADTSGGAFTVTLPAVPITGQAYKIKDKGDALTNNVTIAGTIDGGTNATINTDYGALEVVYDGTEWFTLAFIN